MGRFPFHFGPVLHITIAVSHICIRAVFIVLFAILMTSCSSPSGSQSDASGTTDSQGSTADDDLGFNPISGDAGTELTDQGDEGTDTLCAPGDLKCKDHDTQLICLPDGSAWTEEKCEWGNKCYQGQCSPLICTPGQKVEECASPISYLICNEQGTHWVPKPCDEGLTCYLGKCLKLECEPDSVMCKGFGAVQKCKSDGSGWEVVEFCEKGGSCVNSNCVTACDVNLKAATYRGCEYFSVDLDNIEGGQLEPMALVVSVPSTVNDALVTIVDNVTGKSFDPAEVNATTMTVKAGTLGIFQLPPGNDLDGSGLSLRSYHVKTSAPATVHQFNPLNGEQVYTNDASLLLPSKVGGKKYYAMSWPMRSDGVNILRGFATVVATEPGETEVSITPKSDIEAGPQGIVTNLKKGEIAVFTLTQGQVLNLETAGGQGADLTGSLIESSQRVAAFSGHECANVPLGVTACDHLEQQLLPVEAWGSNYIADSFKKRSPSQFDIWRIMAGGTDVMIETKPPQKGYEKFLLQDGAYVTFPSSESFEIIANGPFLVGHYMIGSNYPGHVKNCKNPDTETESGIGDPALTLAVPMQQYLKEYTVLTPPGYLENYINIVAPAGADVTVDGQALNVVLKQVGALQWGIARVKVSTGVHTIKGKKKFGLTSYGYDCDVSYAYPGGLRLLSLEVNGP